MIGVIFAVILLHPVRLIASGNLENDVLEGNYSKIESFPYFASLSVKCLEPGGKFRSFLCGGSVVNQLIILTAAHCVDGCMERPQDNFVTVGNRYRHKGTAYPISKIIKHSGYQLLTMMHDIALAKLSSELKYGVTVKRIVLMEDPPYFDEPALVAGWGHINKTTDLLMHTVKKVLPREDCLKAVPRMANGALCARVKTAGYAAKGDSGSPLVVRDYIQIGLTSFKYPDIDTKTAVYTDVGYYYDWIKIQVSALMICDEENLKKT